MSLETSERSTVGRDAELAQIGAALDALVHGISGCVAIEGEPGIGKTRLLDELRARAAALGCIVCSPARSAEFERDVERERRERAPA